MNVRLIILPHLYRERDQRSSGYVLHMGHIKNAYKFFFIKPEKKTLLEYLRPIILNNQ
jgi:hypothetical protein